MLSVSSAIRVRAREAVHVVSPLTRLASLGTLSRKREREDYAAAAFAGLSGAVSAPDVLIDSSSSPW